jgi:outer membrane biosynthesis protein TonB
MMQKSKSSVWMRSKVLYIVPMATLALSAFATSENVSPSGNEIAKNEDKVIKISASGQADGAKKLESSVIFPTNENIVYLVDGTEVSLEAAKPLSPEKIESITVFKNPEAAASMGYPGKTVIEIKTKKVVEQVKFLPNEAEIQANGAVLASYDTPQKVSYVPKPAVQAQFKGGDAALMQWLSKNVKYPSEAQNQGVMGKVLVELFITETGQVTNIRAMAFGTHAPEGSKTLPEAVVLAYANEKKAEGRELSAQEKEAYKRAVEAMLAESVRVVSAMPAWEPGYVDKDKKQPCTTRMVLPIVFRLG